MIKNSKLIPLKKTEAITGKKDSRDLVYSYLDFKFKLHRLGDNSEGKAMYRLSPLNFDPKLLKAYSQKNTNLKDACTLQLNDPKDDLLTIFNSVIEVKMKKELARCAYEKALKDGTLPVKEEVVVEKPKKEFSPNKDFRKNSFSRDNRNNDSRKNSFSRDSRNNDSRNGSFSKDNRNNDSRNGSFSKDNRNNDSRKDSFSRDNRNNDSRKNSFSRDNRNNDSRNGSFSRDNKNNDSRNGSFSKDSRSNDSRKTSFSRDSKNNSFKGKSKSNGFNKNKPSYAKKK